VSRPTNTPWFLAYEQAEIRKSGDLGAPMNPLADVFGGPAGLLDALPDRLTEVKQ
jgi:hypothetical protein